MDRPISYEHSLNRLGAWLDGASARGVSILENEGGFIVQYSRQDIDDVFMQRFFSYQELTSLGRTQLRFRKIMARRMASPQRGVGAEEGGYQDILHALGCRLDHQSITALQIAEDESAGNLAVTFQSRENPSQSGVPLSLDTEQRQTLRLKLR